MNRARALGLSLSLILLGGCGSASDGAALLHGTLYAGTDAETSLEFTSRATVHGSAPFRIIIARDPAGGPLGRGRYPAGLTVELTARKLPSSGEVLPIGAAEGPQAQVQFVPEGDSSPTSSEDGRDTRYSDGGFIARAVDGRLQVEFDGRNPGDGVRGTFELVFQSGETVTGTFAATLAD